MKILAIRGQNLASLEGEFAIDLAGEPLASAGVFAITGPTGAGKSTLLDAMCLALFGRTPRLVKQARADHVIGSEADGLSPTDPRAILRRGATNAYAEVDFSGIDRLRYRARWEVRRARGRINGTIQAAEQTLERLDDTPWKVVDRQSEVLDAIGAKLGLDFEQFRRSVLLAQGEFAAFLRASGKERAGLLERVTGSELYTRLSIAAFERAKAAQARLSQIRRESEAIAVCSPEQRGALMAAIAAAQRQRDDAHTRLQPVLAALAWHDHAQVLLAEHRAAEAASAAMAPHEARLRALRMELAQLQVAQELAASFTTWHRTAVQMQESAERVTKLDQADVAAQSAYHLAVAQKTKTQTVLHDLREQHERSRPALQRARELEALARVKAHEHALAIAALAQTTQELQKQEAAVAASLRDHGAAQAQWTTIAAQEQQSRALLKVQAQGPWVIDELNGLASLRAQVKLLLQEYQRAAQEVALLQAKPAQERERVAKLQAALVQVRTRRSELLPVDEWPQLQARRDDLETLRERVRGLQTANRALARWLEVQALEQLKLVHRKAMVDEHGHKLAGLTALQAQDHEAKAAQDRAQVVLSAMEHARSLAEHRGQLQPDKPCPLCGALEHPWFDASVIDRGWQEASQLFASARDHALAVHEQARSAAIQEAHARAAVDHASRALTDATRESMLARQELDAAKGPCAIAGECFATAVHLNLEWTSAQDLAVAKEHERFLCELGVTQRSELTIRENRFEARTALMKQEAELQGELQAAEQQVLHVERGWQQAVQVAEKAANLRDAAQIRVDEKQRGLQIYLADIEDFSQRLEHEDQSLAQLLRDRLVARAEVERAVITVTQRLKQAHEQVEASRREGERLHEACARSQALTQSLQATCEQLEVERGTAIGKRSVAQVEEDEMQAWTQIQAADDAAQRQLQQTELHVAVAKAAKDVEVERYAEVEREFAVHSQTLDRALAPYALARDELALRLARLSALPLLVTQVRELEDAALQAEAKKQASSASLAVHQAKQPSGAIESWRAEAHAWSQARDQAVATEAAERTRVQADDDAQHRRNEGQAALAHEETLAAPWIALGIAIGHNTGDKFRDYAQSLAFDGLLAHANLHLRDLDRRYMLQRVPKTALEIQIVDHDLGDEVRSIHSLSGGESFLISLALALGLSSMTSQREPVESLFIDEGFGTLDRETLDRALAALEALRSGGRQVGMISHVEGLAEHLGVHIDVRPRGGARSSVHVVARA